VIGVYNDVVAAGWGGGAGVVYRPLAEALVAISPVPLAGARVLDAGSGTGAAAAFATRLGAVVVAADLSASMLAATAGAVWPGVVADVVTLPFRAGAFDVAVAGFLLNHLDPEPALRQLAQVVGPGGAVIASTWANRADPVKAATDAVLWDQGWRPPPWYQEMKSDVVSGDPDRLAGLAERAGLAEVDAWVYAVDLGIRNPRDVVAYRLAVPHVAWWWAALDGDHRESLVADLTDAVAPLLAGWRPAAVFLRARVPAVPR
jgi:SAM-dependent methyltransferase